MKKYYKYILVKLPDTRAFPHASLGSDARRHHLATTPRQWGSLTTAACFIPFGDTQSNIEASKI
jgi:hypothetical protein